MRLSVRGAPLGIERRGRAAARIPPLVLLHAFPLDRRMWDRVVDELWFNVDVTAVDFRGLGESELLASPPSIDDHADDLAALLDALAIERAVVCGLSMGGYVALAFAVRHPGRLQGLALADTRAAADSPAQRQARDAAIARIAREGTAAYLDELLPRLCAPSATAALAEALSLARLQPPMGVAGALAALRDRPDRSAQLATLSTPTTVLVGSEDATTPPAEARQLAAAIRGAEVVELPGAGHLSALESPRRFAEVLRGLLERAADP